MVKLLSSTKDGNPAYLRVNMRVGAFFLWLDVLYMMSHF